MTDALSAEFDANPRAAFHRLQQRAATPGLSSAHVQALLTEALEQQEALLRENQQLRTARQALAASEARLQAAEAIAGMGSYELDLASGTLHFSAGLYHLFGETPATCTPSLAWLDARSHPEDAATLRQLLDQAAQDRQPYQYTRRVRRADGQWRSFTSHGRVVVDATGQAIRLEGVVADQTTQRHTAQELLTAKERLQATLDSSRYAVQAFEAVRDASDRIVDFTWVFANKAWQQQYGHGEPVGKSLRTENPGVVSSGLFAQFVQVTETGVPVDQEFYYHYEQFDGWFHQTLVRLGDGFVMNTEDITARRHAEAEQQASRELLQATLDSSLELVQVFEAVRDEAGDIVDFRWILNNQASERVYGEVLGQRLLVRNPGVVEAGIFATFKRVVETGQPDQQEHHYVHEQFDGWFYQSTVKLGDGVATTTADLTRRKLAEQEVLRLKDDLARQAEAQYQTLFNAIGEGYCLIEVLFDADDYPVDYRFLEANAAFEQQTGLAQAVGRTMRELAPTHEQHWFDRYGQVARTGESLRFEQPAAALHRWYGVHAFRLGPAAGHQVAILFQDITARKRHEAHLAFLAEVSQDLAHLTDIDATMNALGEKMAAHLGLSACLFAELFEAAQIAVIAHGWQRADLPNLFRTYRTTEFMSDELRHLCLSGQAVIIRDVFADPRTDGPQYATLHIGSFVGMPLIRAGEWRFLLVVYRPEPSDWRADEIELIRELTTRIWTRLERARVEQALQQSEQELRLFLTASSDVVYKMDANWQRMLVLDGNRFLASTSAPSASWLAAYIPPAEQPAMRAAIEAAIATKSFFELEHRVYQADGTEAWTFSRAVPVLDAAGELVEWFGTATDITARRAAQQAQRESEAKYRTLFNSMDQGYCLIQVLYDEQGAAVDGRFLEVNPAFAQQNDLPQAAGKTFRELVPGIEQQWAALYAEVAATGQSVRVEQASATMERWFDLYAFPVAAPNGGQVAVLFTDITARKRDELAQQALLTKYRHLFEAIDQGFGIAEILLPQADAPTDVRWLEVNPAFERLTGLSPAQLDGSATVRELGLPVEEEWFTYYAQVARTRQPAHGELFLARLGEWFDVYAFPINEAEPPRLGVLFYNSTARREALRRQQVAAVLEGQEEERRRIAESLHNGLGQLLFATKLRLDLLPPRPAEPAQQQATEMLSQAIGQARAISHELSPALLTEFGLAVALKTICRQLQTPTLRWHCHLELAAAPTLPISLQQAVYRLAQGLAHNVAQHAAASEATLEVDALPGWLVIRVEDNGRGFDPETILTGLGLHTLYSRVALLGGTVRVDSAPERGTQVWARLPILPA